MSNQFKQILDRIVEAHNGRYRDDFERAGAKMEALEEAVIDLLNILIQREKC